MSLFDYLIVERVTKNQNTKSQCLLPNVLQPQLLIHQTRLVENNKDANYEVHKNYQFTKTQRTGKGYELSLFLFCRTEKF